MKKAVFILILSAAIIGSFAYFNVAKAYISRPITPVITSPYIKRAIPKIAYVPMIVSRGNTNGKKVVALTFDDGPITTNTTQFCNALNGYGAKATFFMVGRRINTFPEEARIAQTCGEVANHTYSHVDMTTLDYLHQADQIGLGDTEIKNATGQATVWFRPRGGLYNSVTRLLMIKTWHKMVLWDVSGYDTNIAANSTNVKDNVLGGTKPGSIILLHQTQKSLDALPGILAGLKARGYTVTTVSDLLNNYSSF